MNVRTDDNDIVFEHMGQSLRFRVYERWDFERLAAALDGLAGVIRDSSIKSEAKAE